jgi:hypothetical protein
VSQGLWRTGDAVVIFDGQSLNVWPSEGHANSYPVQMLATRPNLARGIAGVAGLSWQQLDNDFTSRVTDRFLRLSPVAVYCMVGGTTQVDLGQAAATIYASELAIATLFRDACTALGVTGWVVGTTTTPSTSFSAGDNVILATLQGLQRADASNVYDGFADLAADPRLDDASDTTYYVDGTHPTTAGAAAIAELVGAAVDALI